MFPIKIPNLVRFSWKIIFFYKILSSRYTVTLQCPFENLPTILNVFCMKMHENGYFSGIFFFLFQGFFA